MAHGKGLRVPQLSFTIQSDSSSFPPPGTHTDKRQIKLAGRPSQERGLPLYAQEGLREKKLEAGRNSLVHAGRDVMIGEAHDS